MLSSDNSPVISFCSVLAICGTVLIISNSLTIGGIILSAGVIGSVIDYSINIQMMTKEQEEKDKLYDGIKQTIESLSSINPLGNKHNKTMH